MARTGSFWIFRLHGPLCVKELLHYLRDAFKKKLRIMRHLPIWGWEGWKKSQLFFISEMGHLFQGGGVKTICFMSHSWKKVYWEEKFSNFFPFYSEEFVWFIASLHFWMNFHCFTPHTLQLKHKNLDWAWTNTNTIIWLPLDINGYVLISWGGGGVRLQVFMSHFSLSYLG